MTKRGSGVLLHITSLPSPYGIGDLGPWAYQFADFLAETRQTIWQILPLNPTRSVFGNSPYSSYSAFAGNPLLISPELLVEDGFLDKTDIDDNPSFPSNRVDYGAVTRFKERLLLKSYERFMGKAEGEGRFAEFCNEHKYWLDDYTLFIALKENFGGKVWSQWPEECRDRREDALREWTTKLSHRITMEKFFQYVFFKQWMSLKTYCSGKNVRIMGDIPVYVNYDSSDVWTNPSMFKLDEEKKPSFVAGVPPDYFSKTGQLWGNPVYRWDALKETGYTCWVQRIGHNLKLFHLIRLDHFRGFVAYWEVPAGEDTAVNGKWVEVPVKDFFNTLLRHFPNLPIIAEDLGLITPDVREVMDHFGFPGMKLLLFAFGDELSTHPYAPHNYTQNCVVYSGTHDNNTIEGWFKSEATPEDKIRLFKYIGREVQENEVHWDLIRLAMMSVANSVIIPMQDLLGLGAEARMNLPATSKRNWEWRIMPEQLTPPLTEKLREVTEIYGRA